MRRLTEWIDDYNSHAPHSALGILSPHEFIEEKQPCQLNRGPMQNSIRTIGEEIAELSGVILDVNQAALTMLRHRSLTK